MKISDKGFTLIESLFVLSIFLLISSITVFSFKPQYDQANMNAFLSQFQEDLFYAQQHAISQQRDMTVNIQPNQHFYYIRGRFDEPLLLKRTYSNKIQVESLSQALVFKFTTDGNISKFGSLRIKSGTTTYRITFLLGKGRFYVVKN